MPPPTASAPRSPRTRIVRLFVIPVGLYLVVAVVFAALQRTLMYPAMTSEPLAATDHALAGAEASDVTATTSDGLVLRGWRFVPTDGNESGRPVVLFLHGNGGNRSHRLDDVDLLTGAGAEVILFDYRGYGENPGSPSEDGLAADAQAMWSFATEQLGVPPDRIILFGESLGGGVATRLAAEKSAAGTPPGGLILRSTFSSMTEAASYHYPWLPVQLVLLDRYDSQSRISKVTCPVLGLHGDADGIVPLTLGRRLFDAAPEHSIDGTPKRFVVLRGAGHNDVLDAARGAYRAAIAAFLGDRVPFEGR